MIQKIGNIEIETVFPGPLIKITIKDTETGNPLCQVEMQPEDFALAMTRNGPQRCKYLNIYQSV